MPLLRLEGDLFGGEDRRGREKENVEREKDIRTRGSFNHHNSFFSFLSD